jgi:hypothetical protein
MGGFVTDGGAATGAAAFFARSTGATDALTADPGAARDVVAVRVVAVLVDDPRELLGAVLAVDASAAAREVKGRFAAVVLAGATVDLRSVVDVLAGDLVAAAEDRVVLRAVGFLFSSPEVIEAMSGSTSDAAPAALETRPVLLADVPGAGRVGGLFSKLEPAVLVRAARAVLVDGAAGRRAPTVAVPPGRRGGTDSGLEGVVILKVQTRVSAVCSFGEGRGPSKVQC